MRRMIIHRKPGVHYSWWILIASCLFILAVMGIVNSCQGIFLVPVTDDLGMSRSQFSMMITLQGLMGVISMPIAGYMIPRFNIRVLLSTASVVYFGSFMAFSSIQSLAQLLVFGALLGFAGGFLTFIPVAVMIGNWFHARQGFAMGLAFSFTGIGGAIFNPVGTMIIQGFGWRSGYLSLGLIGLILVIPAIIVFRFDPREKNLEPYGGSDGMVHDEYEPSAQRSAFRSRPFVLLILWAISIGILGGVMYHIPAFVTQLNHPASLGGLTMSVFMLSMTAGKIVLGYLNDRIGIMKTIILFGLSALTGIVCFIFAGGNVLLLLAGALLFGMGMALMMVETPILTGKLFSRGQYSAVYSIVSMVMNVTATLSVLAYGAVFDTTGSYVPGFIFILLCPFVAYAAAFGALKTRIKDEVR